MLKSAVGEIRSEARTGDETVTGKLADDCVQEGSEQAQTCYDTKPH